MKSVKLSIETADMAISSLKACKANVEYQINLLNMSSAEDACSIFDKDDISRRILLLEYELTCIKNALAETEAIFWQTVKEYDDEKEQGACRPEYSLSEMKDGVEP